MSTKIKSRVEVEDPFFDVADAAVYLNQTERWVRRQVEEERIPYTKMGRRLAFRKSWLDARYAALAPEDRS